MAAGRRSPIRCVIVSRAGSRGKSCVFLHAGHKIGSERILKIRTYAEKIPVWVWVSVLALMVRTPMFLLPGAGRDEAAYHYWSNHWEWSYSILMQWCIKVFSFLPVPPIPGLRLSTLTAGVLVIYVFDKILQHRQMGKKQRALMLSCVALAAWQTYVGTIVHPDNYQFLCVLLVILCAAKERYYLAAVAAGVSVMAKPSGMIMLVVLPVALLLLKKNSRQIMATTALGLLVALPSIVTLRSATVKAISEYGVINANSVFAFTVFLILPTILLGGPIFAVKMWPGLRHRFSDYRNGKRDPETIFTLITACAFFAVFIGAALFRGQLKGNWLLPAIYLLWPLTPNRPGTLARAGRVLAIGLTLLLGLFFSLVFSNPDTMARLEQELSFLRGSYSTHAGKREEKYKAAKSWAKRLNEYQSLDDFTRAVEKVWRQTKSNPPDQVISDDYGLAAQLVFSWREHYPVLVVASDGIFAATVENQRQNLHDTLFLAVYRAHSEIWPLGKTTVIGKIRHPVGGHFVTLAIENATKIP